MRVGWSTISESVVKIKPFIAISSMWDSNRMDWTIKDTSYVWSPKTPLFNILFDISINTWAIKNLKKKNSI